MAPSLGPSGVAHSLAYDVEGNLVEVAQAGSTVARMVYDTAGVLVVKVER